MCVCGCHWSCCGSKNKNTGQALVSSNDLSVPVAGPLDTRPQLWPCTRVSDKSCLQLKALRSCFRVQGTQLGYPVACLALTKYPGLGHLVLASAFILTQSQLWFPLAGPESLIARASAPASMTWPEPWSLHNQDSNLITSISPHNIPEMQTKLGFCCLPLVLSDPHCQSGSLTLFFPISPHHSTTSLHHCQKSYLLHLWDMYLLLPSRSKSPCHLLLLWGATWSCSSVCLADFCPPTLTGHRLQSLPHSKVTGRQCGVVGWAWHEHGHPKQIWVQILAPSLAQVSQFL